MDIITSTTLGSGPSTADATGNPNLGKDEFMKLLLTQMANQDPTEPQSNEEFVAQLAQFAALETNQAVAQQLEGLLMAQAAANQMAAVDLVGKDVTFETDTFTLDDEADPLLIDLGASASNITVVIEDANGNEVRREVLSGAFTEGNIPYQWDGRNEYGDPLMNGEYKIRVTGADGDADSVDARILQRQTVDGISYDEGAPMLLFSDGDVMSMNDVVEVWGN